VKRDAVVTQDNKEEKAVRHNMYEIRTQIQIHGDERSRLHSEHKIIQRKKINEFNICDEKVISSS
jgi:hypothetical protein